jgi:UDP-2-acetamido-3-amino-2,3-dideoxy-glucuronate N-acetyltransferase
VVCGHEIGEWSFIGAGAVVTHPVKPYSLVVGNPARHKGWVSEHGHRLDFDEKGLATCPESGEKYRLKDDMVTKTAS